MRSRLDGADRPEPVDEPLAEVPDAVPPVSLTYFIAYLLRRTFAKFSAETSSAGVDPREFAVLEALAERDWISQGDLAEKLGINRTVMVWLLDRMEESAYVERNRNPENRRTYVLSLTETGRLGLEEMRLAIAQRNRSLTSVLTAAQRERLTELLAALVPDRARPAPDSVEALVAQAFHRYRALGDELVAPTGLQMRHFAPLSALDALAPCAQQQLAQYLAITEPAAAEVVDFLVRAGMVQRGRDKRDRRRYALELTGHGRAALAEVLKAVASLQADTVELIGQDGDEELRNLLYQLLGSPELAAEPR